jgi:hypothetical protein
MTNENPRYELFKHIADEHNFILLDSELDEIINISARSVLQDIMQEWQEGKFQKPLAKIIRERLNE